MSELVKRSELTVPDYMRGDTTGTEELRKVIVPPMIKIVQKMSDLSDTYGVGAVVLSPDNILYQAKEDNGPILFVPLLFFNEFCVWHPIDSGASMPIAERTTDPNSEIARRCRSWSKDDRQDGESGERYYEHLNFLVYLLNEPQPGQPCLLSFRGGEFKSGRKLANLIAMRGTPIYGNIFALRVVDHSNANYTWKGFDVDNPDSDPFVGKDEYSVFAELHEKLKRSQIEARYESEEPQDSEEM